MRKRDDRIGETHTAKNGLRMTIIAYRSANDIDIQFEDGVIVEHKTVQTFIQGAVKHPNVRTKPNREYKGRVSKRKWLGESKIANNGQRMTIIGGTKTKDITVQFEDGTIVEHKCLSLFDSGQIRNPNLAYSTKNKTYFAPSYIGETSLSNHGETMTIIEYYNCGNITVQFEDGTIIKHKDYKCFKNGCISNPNYKGPASKSLKCYKKHIGETKVMKCGQTVKIIDYRKSRDITVELEDGTLINTEYHEFLHGFNKHPNLFTGKRTVFQYNNMSCKFIYKDKTNWYYVCKCDKCGMDEILSAKEMARPHICR